MNKKVIVPILVVIVLAFLVAVVVFAPSILEAALRMHGMR